MMTLEHKYVDGDMEMVLWRQTVNIYLSQIVNMISFCLVLLTERSSFTEEVYYNYVKWF